jgi:hypothetical protein
MKSAAGVKDYYPQPTAREYILISKIFSQKPFPRWLTISMR